MKLRYIALHMNDSSGYQDPFRDNFNLHSRFISNYMSVQVRKLKYDTDDSFNMISVIPSIFIDTPCRIVADKVLRAKMLFNKEKYELMDEFTKYEYYLQLLEEGYHICSQCKSIPLDELLLLHAQFRNGGYKNEWLHKKKRFKEYNIEISLMCYFTSENFQLKISVINFKTKEELISGVVIKTLPDEVCYQPLFKDIIIQDGHLAITEFQDREKFVFNLSDVFNKNFRFKVKDVGLKYVPI